MTSATETIKDASNWVQLPAEPSTFSADDILHAYFTGKQNGIDEIKKAAISVLHSNIQKSGEATTRLTNNIAQIGIDVLGAYLKIISISHLDVLVSVSEKDFISDKFLDVYQLTSDIEKSTEKSFKIMFSYVGIEKGIDEKNIKSEGFVLKAKLK